MIQLVGLAASLALAFAPGSTWAQRVDCEAATQKLALASRAPGVRPVLRVGSITEQVPLMQKAVETTDAHFTGKTPTPEEYRNELEQNYALARAQSSTANRIAAGEIAPSEAEKIFDQELARAKRESVLFLDSPVMDASGQNLNRFGIPFVIDHHSDYAKRVGPLDNTGAQVVQLLKQAASRNIRNGTVDVEAAHADFTNQLFGQNAKRIFLATDNLGDSAEVMAILRNPLLQKRILANPEIAQLVTDSGHYTDFHVFTGDEYESHHPEKAGAIKLAKAILDSHVALLKRYDVISGDRIQSLPIETQKKILREASKAAEKILLEATDTGKPTPLLDFHSAAFEVNRGGPTALRRLDGSLTSFGAVTNAHAAFQVAIEPTLAQQLRQNNPNMAQETIEAKAKEIAQAMDDTFFGYSAVSTRNMYTDASAAAMANKYTRDPQGTRPWKLELGSENPQDIGRKVVIDQSGIKPVNVIPFIKALNEANEKAKEQLAGKLRTQGKSENEIAATLARVTSFSDSRNGTLGYNFGGHALTQGQIQMILGQTAAAQRVNTIQAPTAGARPGTQLPN